MAKVTRKSSGNEGKSYKPLSPEARERQMIALATDLAEQKLKDGTASSQVICHYLKLGTERERLEQEKIRKENDLLEAKKNSLDSAERTEELFQEAINAFRRYGGFQDDTEEDI